MQEAKEELKITMHDGSEIISTQLQPNQATTYLRVTFQVDGSQSAQTTILKQKANKIIRKLSYCHMPHCYGHIHQLCSINPKLTYPLITSSINNKQLKSIHSLIHPSEAKNPIAIGLNDCDIETTNIVAQKYSITESNKD